MKVAKAAIAVVLCICLAVGVFSIFSHISQDGDVIKILEPERTIGGTLMTDLSFDDVTLGAKNNTNYRLLLDGENSNTQFFCETGRADFTVSEGKAVYSCTLSGTESTYPNFKLRSELVHEPGVDTFSYLVADLNISWDVVESESSISAELRMLFNLRNRAANATAVDSNYYFNLLTDVGYKGSARYTFILANDETAVKNSTIYVYRDGEYITEINDFFLTDVDPTVVSCLNIRLPRTAGSTVTIEDFKLRLFEPGYDGALDEFIKEDATSSLSECSDSIFYYE